MFARQFLTRFATPSAPVQATPNLVDISPGLSPQEHKVLLMSSRGHTYEEIAQIIGVSRQTVLTYVKRTYRKLQVHTKIEAVTEAQRMGWLRS